MKCRKATLVIVMGLALPASLGSQAPCVCANAPSWENGATALSTCNSAGDPHYHTWDGSDYDFMGKGVYQLAEGNLAECGCQFTVQSFMSSCQGRPGGGCSPGASANAALAARVGDSDFFFMSDETVFVHSSGNESSLPGAAQASFQTYGEVQLYREESLSTSLSVNGAYQWRLAIPNVLEMVVYVQSMEAMPSGSALNVWITLSASDAASGNGLCSQKCTGLPPLPYVFCHGDAPCIPVNDTQCLFPPDNAQFSLNQLETTTDTATSVIDSTLTCVDASQCGPPSFGEQAHASTSEAGVAAIGTPNSAEACHDACQAASPANVFFNFLASGTYDGQVYQDECSCFIKTDGFVTDLPGMSNGRPATSGNICVRTCDGEEPNFWEDDIQYAGNDYGCSTHYTQNADGYTCMDKCNKFYPDARFWTQRPYASGFKCCCKWSADGRVARPTNQAWQSGAMCKEKCPPLTSGSWYVVDQANNMVVEKEALVQSMSCTAWCNEQVMSDCQVKNAMLSIESAAYRCGHNKAEDTSTSNKCHIWVASPADFSLMLDSSSGGDKEVMSTSCSQDLSAIFPCDPADPDTVCRDNALKTEAIQACNSLPTDCAASSCVFDYCATEGDDKVITMSQAVCEIQAKVKETRTAAPTLQPSIMPSNIPTLQPSIMPSSTPTSEASNIPTLQPSIMPSSTPTSEAMVLKDPHFASPGVVFDFRGKNSTWYNLLSHANVSASALFEHADYTQDAKKLLIHGSYMRALTLTLRTNMSREIFVEYASRRSALVSLSTGQGIHDSLRDNQEAVIDNVNVSFNHRTLLVKTPEWRITATSRVNPRIVGATSCATGRCFLDIAIKPLLDIKRTKVAPHGLLGQGYDGADTVLFGRIDDYRTEGEEYTTQAMGEGAIEGIGSDYAVHERFATAFKYSRYGLSSAKPRNVSAIGGH